MLAQFRRHQGKRRCQIRRIVSTAIERLEARCLLDGGPVISEFLASNDDGLRDANGTAPDWIELFNPGDTAVDLGGWYLTDDPSNPTQWSLPPTPLEPQQYLTVFASGCHFPGIECPSAATELHANFSLNADGEYLALIEPDGITVASEYGSGEVDYPRQSDDVSYGIQQSAGSITWIDDRSPAFFSVPEMDGGIETNWLQPGFQANTSNWRLLQASIGYPQPLQIDFNDRTRGDQIDTEADFIPFTLDDSGQIVDGVRVTLSGFDGAILSDRDRANPADRLPGFNQDQLYDDFVIANAATEGSGLDILLEGLLPNHTYDLTLWSFDPHAARPRVTDWAEVLGDQVIARNHVVDGTVLPNSDYEFTLSSTITSSDDGRLLLRGVRNGGVAGVFLNALRLESANLGSSITSDVRSDMYQAATSAYIQVPFLLPADTSVDALNLEMDYDDGFVAYLNGTEIARRNAPGEPGTPLPGSAVADQPNELMAANEVIDVSAFIPQLCFGDRNVLAIHGLNASGDDSDFLISPRLVATESVEGVHRYFDQPTPGAANGSGFLGIVADISFSADRGFYDQLFTLTITSDTPGATLVYTTDGSLPDPQVSMVVPPTDLTTAPSVSLSIDRTTYVRAMAIKDRYLSTNVDTQTYIFLEDVIRQDPLSDPSAPNYPTVWQANAAADFEMDPEVVAQWDDLNPDNHDFGIRTALKSIPTMSIVMRHDDLWGGRGIYNNAVSRGELYRRHASVEYFDPDSDRQFQMSVGIQMHGNSSRDNVRLKKHSFRLLFNDQYGGPGRLDFPLFPEGNIEGGINTLVLRAFFTDAFATRTAIDRYSPMDSQYLRDVWMKDTQLAMGHLSGHNTYVHLYINGLYWGLYNPSERPDDAFLAGHLGGQREDWDVLKDFNELFRGERRAWSEMFALANHIPEAERPDDIFQQLQGNNPDGTPNADLPNYLDVDNLIDYMILHQYGGAEDWPHHNWYAGRNRVQPGKGFKFFVWDQEIVLDGRFRNLTEVSGPGTPAGLYDLLRGSPSFRLRYADRVHHHFAPGGALSTEASQARWMARANEIEQAIIAESARWGDAREGKRIRIDTRGPIATVPTITVDTWRAERANVRDNYFPEIHARYLQHFADAGLISPLSTPAFNRAGGVVPVGFNIDMSTAVDRPIFDDKFVLPEFSPGMAFVPRDGNLDGTAARPSPIWTDLDYDDSDWIGGTGGVGFDEGSGYEEYWGIDLLSDQLDDGQSIDPDRDGEVDASSFYTRFEFTVDEQVQRDDIDRMQLHVRYDDGFVAYLNGVEIVRTEALPETPSWDTTAGKSHQTNDVDVLDVSQHAHLLRLGERNVLAFHVFNFSLTNSDMLIVPVLAIGKSPVNQPVIYYTTDGSDPRLPDGSLHPNAQIFAGATLLSESMVIRARSWLANRWSAIGEAAFVVNPNGLSGLRISEINYNPYAPTQSERHAIPNVDNDAFEFLELYNADPHAPISLLGARFSDGVDFRFGDTTLEPGEFAVIVANESAFRARYGPEANVIGQWTNQLSNGGEPLTIVDSVDRTVLTVTYDDRRLWPLRADGVGATLELIDADGTPQPQSSKHYRWRGSTELGGSPGIRGRGPVGIVVNEVLTNTNGLDTLVDTIELYNLSDSAIDIGGWYVSDASTNLFKYHIPNDVVLGAGEFWVLDETDFNPNPQRSSAHHFGLSGRRGDEVWLVAPAVDGGIAAFADEVSFPAASRGESFGRTVIGRLAPMLTRTIGFQNSQPRVGPLVISEIHYQPANPSARARAISPELESDDLEFLEILNTGSVPIDLSHWQLRGGIEMNFDDGILLGAGEAVTILSFDPYAAQNSQRAAAFRAEYDLPTRVRLLGGYRGKLRSQGEQIVLRHPINLADLSEFIVEDEVIYDNLLPWPPLGDGSHHALQRVDPERYGSLSNNWLSVPPSPGAHDTIHADLNFDGMVDVMDLDFLCEGIRLADPLNDLNRDGLANDEDVSVMVGSVLGTFMGDVNLDGRFDSEDLELLFIAGEYEDRIVENSTWADGDRNCDGEFTSDDIVLMFEFGGYTP